MDHYHSTSYVLTLVLTPREYATLERLIRRKPLAPAEYSYRDTILAKLAAARDGHARARALLRGETSDTE
jgi:hypothetical protein